MLNKGSVFEKPYESGYGRFCRFLNANWGADTSNKRISDEFEIVFGEPCIVPSGEVERAYKSNCLLRDTHLPPSSALKFNGYHLPNKYRPSVHCPDCARNNYHSYVFELPWVRVCPVHNTTLKSHCPDCGRRWLPGSQLHIHNCKTCGAVSPFEEWVDNDSITKESYSEAFSAHIELKNLIDSELFTDVRIQGIDRYGVPRFIYLINNTWIAIDALNLIGLLPKNLEQYFQITSPVALTMESLSFYYERCIIDEKQYYKNYNRSTKPDFFKLRLQTKAAFESLIDNIHRLGECNSKKEICPLCGAWSAWQQVYRSDHNLEWYPNLKNWMSAYVHVRNYRKRAIAPVLVSEFAELGNKKILLPKSIIEELNLSSSLQFLINLLIQLVLQAEYMKNYPDPDLDAYREMLEKLYKCSELITPSLGAIKHNGKVTFFWRKPKFPIFMAKV